MKLPILEFSYTNDYNSFVDFWSSLYNYKNESLYTEIIHYRKFTEKDIEQLFVWKNGMQINSHNKKKATINDIVSKLAVINNLKANFKEDDFEEKFSKISAICKIFYCI